MLRRAAPYDSIFVIGHMNRLLRNPQIKERRELCTSLVSRRIWRIERGNNGRDCNYLLQTN